MGLLAREFWSASEAYYQKATARSPELPGQEQRHGPAQPSALAQREARWAVDARRYLPPRLQPKPGQLVRVSPHLQELVLEMMQAVAPAMVDAYDRHLGQLALDAFDAWPEDSGYSKSALALAFSVEGDCYVGRLESRAPYTFYIKGQPHRKLLDAPAMGVVQAIGEDVLNAVATRGGGR